MNSRCLRHKWYAALLAFKIIWPFDLKNQGTAMGMPPYFFLYSLPPPQSCHLSPRLFQ